MSLRRFLIPFELLDFVGLALDDLLQVRDAAMALLVLADEGLPALGALNLDLGAFFHEMELDLFLGHLSGVSGHRALFRARVDLVSRTVKFEVLDQITVLVELALWLLGCF